MLSPLATEADAVAFGFGPISEGSFYRASARVRAYTGRAFTFGTYTTQAVGPRFVLPHRPVGSVVSVVDENGAPVDFTLRSGGVLEVGYSGHVTVTHEGGYVELPDGLVELVCSIAARLDSINPAAASGVQQEAGGSESVTFGFDSYNAVSELTTGEKRALDRMFPRRLSVVVMRP